jgi:hypothetical protein
MPNDAFIDIDNDYDNSDFAGKKKETACFV